MSKGLGQMENAPLIYVLAQVKFSKIPRMDKKWEDFHEEVFKSLPRSETERIEQFSVQDGQPSIGDSIQRWHLTDKEERTGVILEAGMILFHTTKYSTSSNFFATISNILSSFDSVIPTEGLMVSRLGLRYIDLLLPEDQLSVDEQVTVPFQKPIFDSIGTVNRTDQAAVYGTAIGGTLVVRHRQSSTTNLLPPDLFPNKLKTAPRLEIVPPESEMVGILDYDHYVEREYEFDVQKISDMLVELHVSTSAAFKATITPEALEKWNGGMTNE